MVCLGKPFDWEEDGLGRGGEGERESGEADAESESDAAVSASNTDFVCDMRRVEKTSISMKRVYVGSVGTAEDPAVVISGEARPPPLWVDDGDEASDLRSC